MKAPSIVKFVSADGLVRYEPRWFAGRPDEEIVRRGVFAVAIMPRVMGDEPPAPLIQAVRTYQLYESRVDSETGNYVHEYRERP